MSNDIIRTTVTFAYPFQLDEIDGELPAGEYTIETERQTLDGSTFIAYRLIETILTIRPPRGSRQPVKFVEVDPQGLNAALGLDKARAKAAWRGEADADAISRADNEGMCQGRRASRHAGENARSEPPSLSRPA